MTQNTRARRAHVPGSVRLAALVLTALALFLTARPARAADWMTPYLEQVQEWGVMKGDAQGNLHEDRNITRAEFVTLVNRAFGYTEPSPDNPFTDVDPNDWFAEDISIARQAGYFNGTTATTASPRALVTREQAAVLLGRCLRFQGVSGAANSTFTDMQDIGGWSRGLVQEAADLGIIQGYADGSFKPDLPITRGQMACFLVRALGTLVQEPGEQTSGGVYGNLTITTPGVKLKDTTVTGNLYLTGGVGLGNVELENVNVLGKIVICGGGEAEGGKQSVLLRNVTAGALELDSLSEQFLSIQAEGLTNIDDVTIRTPGYLEDRTDDGLGLQTIRLDGVEGSLFQLAGNIKRVINLTPESTVQLAQGVADVITMDEKAVDAKLTIDDRASIRELNLDRATEVDGKGDISHLNINAAGSKVSMLPDTIYVRPGITGNVYDQDMDNIAAAEASEDPRLLAGYPKAKNVAPTSADAVFSTNKAGTIHWAITALMDGSLGEEDLMNPSSNAKIVRSGTLRVTASNTEMTARLTGLTKQGSYYISALLEDAKGRRSPVKIAAFTTPDDTAPNFVSGYPQNPILTLDADKEQVAQIMVMANKDCQMYYALFPRGATAPTAADFRTAALSGNLGHGVVDLKKNTPFLVSRINTSHLQEQTQYDLYLWLNDADNGKSSAVRRVQLTTRDMTPPNILTLEPTSSTARSVTMRFALDEPGTLSWVVTKRGDNFGVNTTNPSETDQYKIEGALVGGRVLRKGGPVRYARAGTTVNFTITGLEGQTPYDLYYMAKDTAGNYCVYNKTIEFPYPIKTLDTEGPTAELDYSDKTANNQPWADSDVSIIFSEEAWGANQDQPVKFHELYQKVVNSSGEKQASAKRDLASALQSYITFYTSNPPDGNGKPRPEDLVAVNNGTQTPEQLALLPSWINYREATVTISDGKTIITFPGKGVGLKLQSGQNYYFRLQNIEDTSHIPMPQDPTYKPFSTAFASVKVIENKNPETVPWTNPSAKIFYLEPEGASAVSDDTRWDIALWTDANMKYDLWVRLKDGGQDWLNLGTISPNLDGKAQVYNSMNGNFNSSKSTALLDSGLFGAFKAGGLEMPRLNELNSRLEFGVVPVGNTMNKAVKMYVQIFAGSNGDVRDAARQQGSKTTPALENVTPIGDPDNLPLKIDPQDAAPDITIGYQGIRPRATYANIEFSLTREGTLYCVAVPLDNVTYDADNRPTGTSYTMREAEPQLLDGSGKPALQNLGDSYTATPVPHVKLKDDAPPPEAVVNPEESNYFTALSTTRFANSQRNVLKGRFRINDLTPNTTYLLYLAATNSDGTPSENVLCFKLTTTPPTPPKMYISATGNTVDIQVNPESQLRYVLVDHRNLGSTVFYRPFQAGADYVDASRGPLPDYYKGTTVWEAMKTPYVEEEDDEEGTDTNFTNSVFDIYATAAAKAECWAPLLRPLSGENFPSRTVVLETLPKHVNTDLIDTGAIPMEGNMDPEIPYLLIVGAKPKGSLNYAFQTSGDYIKSVKDPLTVRCTYAPDNALAPGGPGTLTLTFNQTPTYNPSASLDAPPGIDTCSGKENGHSGTTPVDNCVALGSFSSSLLAKLVHPSELDQDHGNPIIMTLRYEVLVPSTAVQLTFNGGLANTDGVPVKNKNNAAAQLYVTLENTGTDEKPNWKAVWSQAYGGTLKDS